MCWVWGVRLKSCRRQQNRVLFWWEWEDELVQGRLLWCTCRSKLGVQAPSTVKAWMALSHQPKPHACLCFPNCNLCTHVNTHKVKKTCKIDRFKKTEHTHTQKKKKSLPSSKENGEKRGGRSSINGVKRSMIWSSLPPLISKKKKKQSSQPLFFVWGRHEKWNRDIFLGKETILLSRPIKFWTLFFFFLHKAIHMFFSFGTL